MAYRQAQRILIGVLAFCAGYVAPALRLTAAPKPTVMVGEFNTPDPKLRIWLDSIQFAGGTTHAELRDISKRIGLKLDVDWEKIPDYATNGNSIPMSGYYGTFEEYLESLLPQDEQLFGRHPWRVRAGTLIVRDPMPAPDAGAVVRVYDISPTFDRLKDTCAYGAAVPWYDQIRTRPPTSSELIAIQNEFVSESIDRLIRDHIEPDAWGADKSWIKTGPGFLIVSATPDVQARVERFIGLINGER